MRPVGYMDFALSLTNKAALVIRVARDLTEDKAAWDERADSD